MQLTTTGLKSVVIFNIEKGNSHICCCIQKWLSETKPDSARFFFKRLTNTKILITTISR